MCVNALYPCIRGAARPIPHCSPSCHHQKTRPPGCFSRLRRAAAPTAAGDTVAFYSCHPRLSFRHARVSRAAGAAWRVGSGSAPAWSQFCSKTCFGKLCTPAGVPSAVLPTGNVAAAVLGVCGPLGPGCGQERREPRSASPGVSRQPSLPLAPFPHFPGQRWPRARGAARGNDPHAQSQRGAAALASPRALPRTEGVTQSQGPLHTPFVRQLEAAPAEPESPEAPAKGLWVW